MRGLVAWNPGRIRVKRGLSQERLAFDAGIDRSYVGGLERQEENPTVDPLDRLAKTYPCGRETGESGTGVF
jgi:transcriptional regulator with XRE-family HTH domain